VIIISIGLTVFNVIRTNKKSPQVIDNFIRLREYGFGPISQTKKGTWTTVHPSSLIDPYNQLVILMC
jgi:hypothetical protein